MLHYIRTCNLTDAVVHLEAAIEKWKPAENCHHSEQIDFCIDEIERSFYQNFGYTRAHAKRMTQIAVEVVMKQYTYELNCYRFAVVKGGKIPRIIAFDTNYVEGDEHTKFVGNNEPSACPFSLS